MLETKLSDRKLTYNLKSLVWLKLNEHHAVLQARRERFIDANKTVQNIGLQAEGNATGIRRLGKIAKPISKK